MECIKLLSDLTDLIIQELLSNDNVAHFYLDAIEFDNEKLQIACESLLARRFDEVIENDSDFIMGMQKVFFKRLIDSDQINIPNEYCLVELIKDFIEKR
jgi:hypothetical protein